MVLTEDSNSVASKSRQTEWHCFLVDFGIPIIILLMLRNYLTPELYSNSSIQAHYQSLSLQLQILIWPSTCHSRVRMLHFFYSVFHIYYSKINLMPDFHEFFIERKLFCLNCMQSIWNIVLTALTFHYIMYICIHTFSKNLFLCILCYFSFNLFIIQ